jgi:hypothetical protein
LGPYYKKNAPFTLNLGYDLAGENFVLSDKKLNVRCEPVEGELLVSGRQIVVGTMII